MDTITITAKLQLNVEPNVKNALLDTARAYTKACNFVSAHIFATHDLKMCDVNAALYHILRDDFSLKSQMAQSAIKTVIARYKSILTSQNKWIKPVFHSYEYDLVWNRDYSLSKNNTFSVNTLEGRMRAPFFDCGMERYFENGWKFGTAKLVNKHGKLFLHVPVTMEIDAFSMDGVTNIVGIDRGIRFLAVSYGSTGKTAFYSGAQVKQKRAHYKALRQELQKKGTSSARRRLRQIGQRENRWMHDVNHCVSKALVASNPEGTLFVLEDLTGIRSATERVRTKDRYVSVSWAYYDLEQKLKYKARMNNSQVINVDPAYTSQTCPKCGHKDKRNRNKEQHIFKCCSCGYCSNDDRIGAMNLYGMGIEYLVESQDSISVS